MNELTVFNNEQFGQLRTVAINGEPWFILADICRFLGLARTNGAAERVPQADLIHVKVASGGQKREMLAVNEAGVYLLLMRSNKEEAVEFQNWLAHDVIPSIRKNGGYITGQEEMTDAELLARAHEVALRIIEEKDRQLTETRNENIRLTEANNFQAKQIEDMQPKVDYYTKILNCPNAIPITIIAKDYGWTAIRMNKFLHEKGIQFKANQRTWVLYQKYANKGYTKTTTWVDDSYGHAHIHTYWTQTGREFIYKLLKAHGFLPIIDVTGEDPTAGEDINFRPFECDNDFDIDDIF